MAKKAQATFEEALARLEEIVKLMEGGKLTLDETTALFEEGVKLTALLKGRLNIARNKVMLLTEDQNGLKEVEFNDADE
jgi:exodeoxyribonuclease VII small subunit